MTERIVAKELSILNPPDITAYYVDRAHCLRSRAFRSAVARFARLFVMDYRLPTAKEDTVLPANARSV